MIEHSGKTSRSSAMVPYRGLVFVHTFWLDAEYRPLHMRVTRIAGGSLRERSCAGARYSTVYYRALDGSFLTHCRVDQFSQVSPTPAASARPRQSLRDTSSAAWDPARASWFCHRS
jgi:hypothetical protein